MNRVEGDTSKGCTLRAVIIGFVLLPLNAYWIAQTEIVWHAIWPTLMSLFFNVIFILFILLGLNSLVKNWLPKAALTQKELLVIYIILCMGTSVAGNNFLENIVSTIGHGFWFATPENEWTVLFWRYIPTWLTISDKKILSGFYEGDSTLYTADYLKAWATIMVPWFVFILVFVFVMMCINVILRKQWTEKEKLAYPIIQIPIEMTKMGTFSGLFRNPLFIVGEIFEDPLKPGNLVMGVIKQNVDCGIIADTDNLSEYTVEWDWMWEKAEWHSMTIHQEKPGENYHFARNPDGNAWEMWARTGGNWPGPFVVGQFATDLNKWYRCQFSVKEADIVFKIKEKDDNTDFDKIKSVVEMHGEDNRFKRGKFGVNESPGSFLDNVLIYFGKPSLIEREGKITTTWGKVRFGF